ncbi:hypothetical protein HanOQP8_Chr03g0109291 [Helianthus annuus]|nr:hypothetical protein HanOQP8_Chr03g0109291 [Helianthus annuus]
MGSCKLKVNIARFAVENSGIDVQTGAKTYNPGSSGAEEKSKNFNVRDSRSYREVLGKFKVNGDSILESGGSSGISEKVLVVPDRTIVFNEVFGVALVGKTVDLETLVDFDRLLKIAGTEYVKIQYLGGLSILISFSDVESAKRFLDAKVVWGPWFSKLETWNGQSLPLERVAWLRIHGVPLHILDPNILAQIGELFGKVLHVPKLLVEEQDLSVCRVGILVGESFRLREVVALKWKNRCYWVRVEEEEEVWLPDCLKSSEEVFFRRGFTDVVVSGDSGSGGSV